MALSNLLDDHSADLFNYSALSQITKLRITLQKSAYIYKRFLYNQLYVVGLVSTYTLVSANFLYSSSFQNI